ncbi:hypothetical protein [Kangiella sp.]|uniref:hypothetical protein n=1 Tax=Kangiella sp. TaxID=1920245 RepID=UPI003A930854
MSKHISLHHSFFRPFLIMVFTQTASFLAWAFPSFDVLRKGFDKYWDIFSYSSVMFLMAYLTTLFTCYFFYLLGNRSSGSSGFMSYGVSKLEIIVYYYVVLIFSLIGVSATIGKIVSVQGVDFFYVSLVTGQANNLKETLYDEYSIGLMSLRYACILLMPLLILKRFYYSKSYFDVLPILLLFSIVIISSRLALVFSVFLSIYIYTKYVSPIRFSLMKVFIVSFLGYFLLSALNYSRNFGYYDQKGMGFFAAGFSEIITYLGAPFQGAIYVFGRPEKNINLTNYPETTIEFVLNTNSAFMHKISDFGQLGYFYILFFLAFCSFYVGWANKRKYLCFQLVSGVIYYCFAEFWRVFLFDQGIVITLVVLSFLCGLVFCFFKLFCYRQNVFDT